MSAYWVARVHITDPVRYGKYMETAGLAVEAAGGTILVRGGRQIELEGPGYERTVVARFDTLEQAEACYHSDMYQAALQHARGAADRLMVVVEGVG